MGSANRKIILGPQIATCGRFAHVTNNAVMQSTNYKNRFKNTIVRNLCTILLRVVDRASRFSHEICGFADTKDIFGFSVEE
jgi:hypothetical protein